MCQHGSTTSHLMSTTTKTGRNQTFSALQGFKTFCVPFILQFLGKVGMVGDLVGGGGGVEDQQNG